MQDDKGPMLLQTVIRHNLPEDWGMAHAASFIRVAPGRMQSPGYPPLPLGDKTVISKVQGAVTAATNSVCVSRYSVMRKNRQTVALCISKSTRPDSVILYIDHKQITRLILITTNKLLSRDEAHFISSFCRYNTV